jgi:hypothetical protein
MPEAGTFAEKIFYFRYLFAIIIQPAVRHLVDRMQASSIRENLEVIHRSGKTVAFCVLELRMGMKWGGI